MDNRISLKPLNMTSNAGIETQYSNQALAAKRDAAVMSPLQQLGTPPQNAVANSKLQQAVWGKTGQLPPDHIATLSVARAANTAFTLGDLIKTYDDNMAKSQQNAAATPLPRPATQKSFADSNSSLQQNAQTIASKQPLNPPSPLASKAALKELLSDAKEHGFIDDHESKELAKLLLKKESNKLIRLFSKFFRIQPKVNSNVLSKERLQSLAQSSFIDTGPARAAEDFALGKKVSLNGKKFIVYADSNHNLYLVKLTAQLGQGSFGRATKAQSFSGSATSSEIVMKTALTKSGDDYHKGFAMQANTDLFSEASNINFLHHHGKAANGKLVGIQDKPHKVIQFNSAKGKEKVAHLGALYGGTCEKHLFEGEEARSAVWQTFTGLQTMQQLNMHHGDIKPANLFYRKGDSSLPEAEIGPAAVEVHIADFGGARQLDKIDEEVYSAFSSSAGYKPPGEYLTKEELLSADVYALSLSCCEMILGAEIGKRLFDAENGYSKGIDSEIEPQLAKECEDQLIAKGLPTGTAQLLIKALSPNGAMRPLPKEICDSFAAGQSNV